MKVLIACERFGVIRDTFINAGHDAWSCDMVDSEVPGPHIRGDALSVMEWGWDLMIAHPDCTYLTRSAAWAYGDGPYHQHVKPGTLVGEARRAAREQALAFVAALAAAPIPFIAIENPAIGALNKHLDLIRFGFRSNFPTQIIQPHQYGHDASKTTGLALKGLPDLQPTSLVEPSMMLQPSGRTLPRWSNQTDSDQNRLPPRDGRAMARAKTYRGWADAMATQWGPVVAAAVAMEAAA
ncbi:hypothetical protein [Aeromonas eucrenophila]|uniref:DNA cytosine methyltransferase n=1 Tax=Aeromonas eucrenophila TaxID=649 RepID=A0ABW0Y9C6_9GAMM|nr:hypothetical protein [Aeromonas eucrenophila]